MTSIYSIRNKFMRVYVCVYVCMCVCMHTPNSDNLPYSNLKGDKKL